MIGAAVVGLTLMSSLTARDHPETLIPAVACRLATGDDFVEGRTYAIRGKWASDGRHTSILYLPQCEAIIERLEVDGPAAKRIAAFHRAFLRKCGSHLQTDDISGVFIGQFVRGQADTDRTVAPDLFVVSNLKSSDENPDAVTCPTRSEGPQSGRTIGSAGDTERT